MSSMPILIYLECLKNNNSFFTCIVEVGDGGYVEGRVCLSCASLSILGDVAL
jgi:hypothetical protein